MKQVLQLPRQAFPAPVTVPDPVPLPGLVLIRTCASLISSGTERGSVKLARASLLGKARQRPDQVREVLRRVRREGLQTTWNKVRHRLSEPLCLGYSAAGTVIACGPSVNEFRVGDRVAATGQNYAGHAEYINVPKNLVCPLPDSVSYEVGSFVAVGAVALHGVRTSGVRLGETVAVIGLGLVGQLTCQLLSAQGNKIIGVDPEPTRRRLAEQTTGARSSDPGGAESLVADATDHVGVDAVIICAASDSPDILHQAATLARDRATIVIVGAVPIEVPRAVFYRKELELRIARSYGPGRYDPSYEEKGTDYPISYVRWTENRNMRAFLDLIAERRVDVSSLITHRFDLSQAEEAYRTIESPEPGMAVVFTYPDSSGPEPVVASFSARKRPVQKNTFGVGLWGAGAFAGGVLAPILLKRRDVRLLGVATRTPISAERAMRQYRIAYGTCRGEDLLEDSDIDTVIISTPHRDHAGMAATALKAGKAVFLEKPAAVDREQLRALAQVVSEEGCRLQIGFNRRYAPAAREVKNFFANVSGPKTIAYRVNAGRTPKTGWLSDSEQGGRLIGEMGHFVDLVLYLTGSWPKRVTAERQGPGSEDGVIILLTLMDGSVASIAYVVDAQPQTPKEYIEVFGGGRTAVIDDFSRWSLRGTNGRTEQKSAKQDKGHSAQFDAFFEAIRSDGLGAGDWAAAISATETTFAAVESLQTGAPVSIRPWF